MDITTIKTELSQNHTSFIEFIVSLTHENFLHSKKDKWTAGQQLEHIYLGVKPVRQILHLPKFSLKMIWGQANRQSRSYEELVKKYLLKLEDGGKATGRFVPKAVNIEKRQTLKTELEKELASLCAAINKFTEEELDKYILPHPLLGKLTIREMLYFTIYHVKHHEDLTKRNLS